MAVSVDLIKRLEALPPEIRDVFLSLLGEIERRLGESVTKKEFNELREIVKELAEAQRETERSLKELAEAQKRTEEEVRKLAVGLRRTRDQVGGLSQSVAYALENEAFRRLPLFLKERHGIEVVDRLIREEIAGEEINLFARARRDGTEVILVGEAVLRLDDSSKLRQLRRKVGLVAEEYGGEVLPIIVTHFATKRLLERAKKAGFIVVQSFEW